MSESEFVETGITGGTTEDSAAGVDGCSEACVASSDWLMTGAGVAEIIGVGSGITGSDTISDDSGKLSGVALAVSGVDEVS